MSAGLNIYQRLAKIRELVEVLVKNESGYNFKYVSEDEILAKVTGGMKTYHVSLIPSIVPGTYEVISNSLVKPKFTKTGERYEDVTHEYVVHSEMNYRWICDDDPTSFIDVPWVLVGSQGEASQAFGSGLTYCNRYFLLKYFNVSTVADDPDNWKSKQREAEKAEEIKISENLAQTLHMIVTSYLDKAKTKESRDEVTKYLKTKLKDSNNKATVNYFEVKDPEILSSVIDEFPKKFKIEEEKKTKE